MSTSGFDTWKLLLRRALDALDALESVPAGDWSFGGGTSLMIAHQHRLSRDVDIFLRDAQTLAALSPRLNSVTERMTHDYLETATTLRLAFPEGEVDFIVAPDLLGLERGRLAFEGRSVPIDAPGEVVAKKLFYRAADLKVRDVFDVAVVLLAAPELAAPLRSLLHSRAAVLQRRVTALAADFPSRLASEIVLLDGGAAIAPRALQVAQDFVASLAP